MTMFDKFTANGIKQTISVIGETAFIAGNQFKAAFEESTMDVSRFSYGDSDEINTRLTCLKKDLSNTPRIGETLTRLEGNITYVIQEVSDDLGIYKINLRAKNA